MSAPGSSGQAVIRAVERGFTLVELLLVLALMAVGAAGVVLSLRESGEQQLELEAQRLVAKLDAARAQSRATGVAVTWRPDASGFAFAGLQEAQSEPIPWLEPGTLVRDPRTVVLGPEPIIERQEIELMLGDQSLRIGTDGLRPFAVLSADSATGPAP